MNLIILVCAVLSMNTIRNAAGALLIRFLGEKWWARLIAFVVGAGLGLLYFYFAGYFIMDKNAVMLHAAVVGLVPFVASMVYKLVTRVRLIEEI